MPGLISFGGQVLRFYEAQGQIHRHISALVNVVPIQYQNGWATSLPQGAEIVFLPRVGGG